MLLLRRLFSSSARLQEVVARTGVSPLPSASTKEASIRTAAAIVGWAAENTLAGSRSSPPRAVAFHLPTTPQSPIFSVDFESEQPLSTAIFPSLQKTVQNLLKSKASLTSYKFSEQDIISIFGPRPLPSSDFQIFAAGKDAIGISQGPLLPRLGKSSAQSSSDTNPSSSSSSSDSDSISNLVSVVFLNVSQVGGGLQRIEAAAFASEGEKEKWTEEREKAHSIDHRVIGKQQELFFFDDVSPGSPFLLPHGVRILSALTTMLKQEYLKRGYEEVISPVIFDKKLWERSGHWKHYREDMFLVVGGGEGSSGGEIKCAGMPGGEEEGKGAEVKVVEAEIGLKPMNCPGHCLMFAHRSRSYRELPLRLAEFAPLHRNEAAGALSGLTRVRRFVQDDAHIFCAESQMKDEIVRCLDFVKTVYQRFNMPLDLALSTRPESFIGSIEQWDAAEAALSAALNEIGYKFRLNPKDGAFYGPKIDIALTDAIGRRHQCGTIQLDFQLPINFDLHFVGPDNKPQRPVIVHRAVLGSLERFLAILIEHFGGKWPLWLNPRQMIILPLNDDCIEYAKSIAQTIRGSGFHVEVGGGEGEGLKAMIRAAQEKQFSYILVAGAKEREMGGVNVRDRDQGVLGTMTVDEFLQSAKKRVENFE